MEVENICVVTIIYKLKKKTSKYRNVKLPVIHNQVMDILKSLTLIPKIR